MDSISFWVSWKCWNFMIPRFQFNRITAMLPEILQLNNNSFQHHKLQQSIVYETTQIWISSQCWNFTITIFNGETYFNRGLQLNNDYFLHYQFKKLRLSPMSLWVSWKYWNFTITIFQFNENTYFLRDFTNK